MYHEYHSLHEAACLVPQIVAQTGNKAVDTTELLGFQFAVLEDFRPFVIPGRKLGLDIARAEIRSLIGLQPLDVVQRDLPLGRFHDGPMQWGNYGDRIRYQMLNVLRELQNYKTRQAVLTIYDGNRDLAYWGKDTPCTLSIQFLIRDRVLTTIVTMRSNDVWLGLPYDLMQFGTLHRSVAQWMKCEPGMYIHQAGSLHVYDWNQDDIMSLPDYGKAIGHDRDPWSTDDWATAVRFCQYPTPGHTDLEKWLMT